MNFPVPLSNVCAHTPNSQKTLTYKFYNVCIQTCLSTVGLDSRVDYRPVDPSHFTGSLHNPCDAAWFQTLFKQQCHSVCPMFISLSHLKCISPNTVSQLLFLDMHSFFFFFFFSQGLVLTMEEFSRHFLCLLFFRPYFLPQDSQWNLGLEDTHGLFFLLAKTPVLLLPCEFRLNFFFQSRLTSKAGCFDITTEL